MHSEQLLTFLQSFPEISYKKGDKVLRPYEFSEHIYFVKRGYVRVFKILKSGQEVSFNWYNPDKQQHILFGYSDLLAEYHIEAFTDVQIHRMKRSELQEYLKTHPEDLVTITNDIVIFFAEALKQVEWLSIPDAYTRLKVGLHIIAERTNFLKDNKMEKGQPVELKLTHQIIASYTGLSRETVTIQINKLIGEGYILREGNTLFIKDLDHLIKSVK